MSASSSTSSSFPTTVSMIPPKPGDNTLFKKKYQLKGELGKGNYSVVVAAINTGSGMQVAVKCVDKKKLTKEDDEALKVEVAILHALGHPHIIRLYDWFEDLTNYFVVTEFMGGGELFDRIVKREYYSEEDAQKVVRTIVSVLKYLHERNIVHRDLKPENILLLSQKDDSSIKIADFGFARVVNVKGQTTACGTPGYVAPEIINGKPYGLTVDIWSLGVIIYILLCGYPPFYNQNQAQLFKLIREGKFVFDKPYWDPISADAKGLIKAMLTVDIKQRPNIDGVMSHPWVLGKVSTKDITPALGQLKLFNARRKLRAGIQAALAANKFVDLLKQSVQKQ
jgi:calcium/calmodulin-dependent protein kinase I